MDILKGGVSMTNILTNENFEVFFPTETMYKFDGSKKIKNKKFYTILTFLKLKYSRAFNDIIEKYIVHDKGIRNGEATIKGTRISTLDLLCILDEAREEENKLKYIYEQYPSITDKEQILAAILYMIKKTSTIPMLISIMCS